MNNKMNKVFHKWWESDAPLEDNNPYEKDTPAYWAWEGWREASIRTRKVCSALCYLYASQIETYKEGTHEEREISAWVARACGRHIEELEKTPQNWRWLTDYEWGELWEEFDDKLSDLDEEFQASMIAKHGEGYYHIHPEDSWASQQELIQRLVEAKLKEKNHG